AGTLNCGTCGLHSSCPSGTCVCDSGWGDCNDNNICDCDLSLNSCSGGSCVEETVWLADNCSQQAVQDAINLAGDGDIVQVPAGACVWVTGVSVSSDKKIVLQGAGMDFTVITRSPSGEEAVNLGQSGSRVTGFKFIDGEVVSDGDGWRVDHCWFYSEVFSVGVYVRSDRENDHPTGLVDHNVFYNTRVVIGGWAGLLAHSYWYESLGLGTNNAVFVEDNEFTATMHSNAMDANYGGRYVFRYNIVNDNSLEAHSVQGNHRSTRSWEIYGNTINQINRAMWIPMFLRGGTGVVFNNTLTGTWTNPNIALDNVRSGGSYTFPPGNCDGISDWDGNEEANGYPCRDQIGRSTDSWLWTDENPYPPQELDPAYFWNNKHNGNDVVPFIHNSDDAWIVENRDYYVGIEKPGYTPYTYPHPLTLN
ncbi:hypothetical protein KAJ38_03510, partial [Candidatus Pacearchaeota archaeon]|nr:hypothetical protein [Candidatus Pacearchaeota archaeon]